MEKIRVLIIEDEADQADELKVFLEKGGYSVCGIADNLTEGLGLFYALKPDLVVADIYLKGNPEGISFAERMGENMNTARPLIFLTQHADFETFRQAKLVSPYSYLLKPFNPLELQYAIELAMEKFASQPGGLSIKENALLIEESLFVKHKQSLIKIPISNIEYVEVDGKYCKINAREGSFLVQLSLVKMEEKLQAYHFLRIHRNYIINLNEIRQIHLTDNQVILNGERALPVSHTYKDILMKRFDVLR